MRAKLNVNAGGVIFTTIQKFLPEEKGDQHPVLSDRRNIVVIADEAHRSQYDFIDGFARHMRDALPNASFIGFTGTPIEQTDKNTRAVFGDYISVYDIQRAVDDKATVPIYYESRLAKLELERGGAAEDRPGVRGSDRRRRSRQEREAQDQVGAARSGGRRGEAHRAGRPGPRRALRERAAGVAMEGKAMIVCMSRRICVDLYNAIIKLRPDWHRRRRRARACIESGDDRLGDRPARLADAHP